LFTPRAQISTGEEPAAVPPDRAGGCNPGACRAELERGDLVRVLSDWRMEAIDLHAIFPAARVPKPSARAFADYFGRELRHAKAMT
jgi:DNA-binding transcriptional LysR family regulator